MFGQGRGVRGGRAVQPCGGRQPAEAMLASSCARYVCDTHICPLTTLLCLISSFLPQLLLVPAAIHSTSSRPSSAAAWVAAAAWAALGEHLPACWHACMHACMVYSPGLLPSARQAVMHATSIRHLTQRPVLPPAAAWAAAARGREPGLYRAMTSGMTCGSTSQRPFLAASECCLPACLPACPLTVAIVAWAVWFGR